MPVQWFLREPSSRPRRLSNMNKAPIYEEPSEVVVRDGAVVIEGPDTVEVSLTPDAARETSDRLLEAAMRARGEAVLAERNAGRATDELDES